MLGVYASAFATVEAHATYRRLPAAGRPRQVGRHRARRLPVRLQGPHGHLPPARPRRRGGAGAGVPRRRFTPGGRPRARAGVAPPPAARPRPAGPHPRPPGRGRLRAGAGVGAHRRARPPRRRRRHPGRQRHRRAARRRHPLRGARRLRPPAPGRLHRRPTWTCGPSGWPRWPPRTATPMSSSSTTTTPPVPGSPRSWSPALDESTLRRPPGPTSLRSPCCSAASRRATSTWSSAGPTAGRWSSATHR